MASLFRSPFCSTLVFEASLHPQVGVCRGLFSYFLDDRRNSSTGPANEPSPLAKYSTWRSESMTIAYLSDLIPMLCAVLSESCPTDLLKVPFPSATSFTLSPAPCCSAQAAMTKGSLTLKQTMRSTPDCLISSDWAMKPGRCFSLCKEGSGIEQSEHKTRKEGKIM